MQKKFITKNDIETRELGKVLAQELRVGGIICLDGELGAGKTTFTQGLLEGLGAEKPYTSPTFLIMKEYGLKANIYGLEVVYHFDVYRVGVSDILDLGWEEIIADKNNVVIIEWAERIKDIIPKGALWIKFEWMGEEERRIVIKND